MEEHLTTPNTPDRTAEKPAIPSKPPEKTVDIPVHRTEPVQTPNTQTQLTDIKEHLKKSDRWMIYLTAAIAFFALCSIGVGLLQWNAMLGQLKEMRGGSADTHALAQAAQTQAEAASKSASAASDSALLAKETMMLDQRAWISVGLIDNQLFDGQPIQSPVVIGNTGKTPALKVKGDIVLQLLKPNETPTFIYGSGHPRSHIPEVTMLPNQQIHLSAAALQKVQGPNPDVILATPTIRKQLESENLLIAVHGNITYTDIFGLQHWVHFCSFGKGGSSKGPNLGAEKCDEYNDVDHDK